VTAPAELNCSGWSRRVAEKEKEAMTLGAQSDDRAAVTNPNNHYQTARSHHRGDESTPVEVIAPTERDRELSDLVDHLEDRIAAEEETHTVSGNAAETGHTIPTDTGDEPPD
jgi:hypothetical protein